MSPLISIMFREQRKGRSKFLEVLPAPTFQTKIIIVPVVISSPNLRTKTGPVVRASGSHPRDSPGTRFPPVVHGREKNKNISPHTKHSLLNKFCSCRHKCSRGYQKKFIILVRGRLAVSCASIFHIYRGHCIVTTVVLIGRMELPDQTLGAAPFYFAGQLQPSTNHLQGINWIYSHQSWDIFGLGGLFFRAAGAFFL